MRKLALAALAAVLLLTVLAPTAFGAGCPVGFHEHPIDDPAHEHEPHQHVGLSMEAVDANGDNLICVKHVTPDGSIHVHVDNNLP